MAGRARDQRHHGRRGPAAARVPRHPHRRADRRRPPAGSVASSAPTAPGRTSTAAPATCPRRSRPTWRCGWPATRRDASTWPAAARLDHGPRRHRGDPRVHPDLAGPVRPVVLGRPAGHAARADLPAGLVPAERLRLGLLGPADDRPADRRRLAPPGPVAAVRPRRAARRRRPTGRPESRAGRTDGWASACSAASTARCTATSGTACGRAPARGVRAAAIRRCADWIIARQEQDGCWGGIQPPWVYSLIALHLLGYGLDHPVIKRGLAGLDRFTIWEDTADGPVRRLEACQSPVWDTVLAMIALADAGLPPDHPALRRAASWVLAEEIRGPGDWQVRRPGPGAGRLGVRVRQRQLPGHRRHRRGACSRCAGSRCPAEPGRPAHAAIGRGPSRWLTGMQSTDGGWGAFDADNTRDAGHQAAVLRLRRGHRSAVGRRHRARRRGAGRGRAWPASRAVAPGRGLAAASAGSRRLLVRPVGRELRLRHGRRGAGADRRRACCPASRSSGAPWPGWIEHQNPDGGWGEDLRSYDDPAWAGPGRVHRLADRLGAARAARGRRRGRQRRAERGVRWLAEHPARRTAPGTSRSSPAPASPATSTSTTTCTGWSSRSARSAGTWRVARDERSPLVCAPLPRLAGPARLRSAPACAEPGRSGGRRRRCRCAGPATGRPGGRSGGQSSRQRSFGALAVAGTGGGLTADLQPGRPGRRHRGHRRPATSVRCPSAPLLAGELRRAGLRVHGRPIATVDQPGPTVASGTRLAAAGALAVDMESAPLARGAGGRPGGGRPRGVRHPARSLLSPRALAGGLARAAVAAAGRAGRWPGGPRPAGPRQVLLAGPRSFCAGVERAIEIVERALERHGAAGLRAQADRAQHPRRRRPGASAARCSSTSSSEVPDGAIVVFSAHGVSPAVRARGGRRGPAPRSTRPARWWPRCTPRRAGSPPTATWSR